MQKTLSISVAAYNIEQFIRQCLDSFVESGVISDIEVIVTDDGSKDKTPDIVGEYVALYPESIKLIKQKNAGPGSTVNSGIANATGKYFRMVDGDDWVNGQDFKKLVDRLKNTDSDAVVCNYVTVDNQTGMQTRFCVDLEDSLEYGVEDAADKLSISMHNIIFKTEIAKKIELFNCFYTDAQYLLFPFKYVKTVTYFNLDIYMYRVALGTQSMSVASLQRNINMHDNVLFSLVDFLGKFESENDDLPNTARFIAERIVNIAGCELGTLLSFKPSKEKKAQIVNFLARLEKSSSTVYNMLQEKKTVKVLGKKGLTYYLVSFLHRKKLGL